MTRLSDGELFDGLKLPLRVDDAVTSSRSPRIVADSVKVVFVTDGWAHLIHTDGQAPLGPGSIVAIPHGVWCAANPEGFVRTVTLYLHTDFLDAHLRWLPKTHPLVHHLISAHRGIGTPETLQVSDRTLLTLRPKLSILAALNRAPCGEFATLARIADLFDELASLGAGHSSPVSAAGIHRPVIPRQQVAAAARAMHTHLDQVWTVAALARQVSLSESQLTRLFRQDLGLSPAAFLWQARTDRMADLLAATDTSIAKATRVVGWASASAASRAFKRRYGVSPRLFALRARESGSGTRSHG